MRKEGDTIERQALEWNPQGAHRRGKPRGTCAEVFSMMQKTGRSCIGKEWSPMEALCPQDGAKGLKKKKKIGNSALSSLLALLDNTLFDMKLIKNTYSKLGNIFNRNVCCTLC